MPDNPALPTQLASYFRVLGFAGDAVAAGARHEREAADYLWSAPPTPEQIRAAGQCWHNGVLYQHNLFSVTMKVCADIASLAVPVRDPGIASQACELNQQFKLAPLNMTLPFAAKVREQIRGPLHQNVRAVCALTRHLQGPSATDTTGTEGAWVLSGSVVLGYSMERVARYQESLEVFQQAASDLGAGPATWMAEQAAETARSCVLVLSNEDVLCTYGAQDPADIINKLGGNPVEGTTVKQNALAELLTSGTALFEFAADAAEARPARRTGGRERGPAGSSDASQPPTASTRTRKAPPIVSQEGGTTPAPEIGPGTWFFQKPPDKVLRDALTFAAAHFVLYGPPSLFEPVPPTSQRQATTAPVSRPLAQLSPSATSAAVMDPRGTMTSGLTRPN